MQKLVLLTSISFGMLIGVATAEPLPQPNRIQGTPGSLFPYAAPHEIKIINGIPCRTNSSVASAR